jgi:hypothetical protein
MASSIEQRNKGDSNKIPFPDVDPVRTVPGGENSQPPAEGMDAGPPDIHRNLASAKLVIPLKVPEGTVPFPP